MLPQIIGNSIITGSIYSVIAFGFTIMYSTMGFFNMAYGANILTGAYVFYVFYRLLNLPLMVAVVISLVLTAALMSVIDRLSYYKLRNKRVPSWTIVVVSISVNLIIESAISMIFGSRTRVVYPTIPKVFNIFGASITSIQIAVFVVSLLVMIATHLFLKKTKMGKIIRALSNDRTMSSVVGIDVEQVFLIVTVVVSMLATAAGIFSALDTDIRPRMGSAVMLKAITCSIVGGVGNIRGAMIAAFLFAVIETAITFLIGSGWKDGISLLVVIVLMLVSPKSFGLPQKN